MRECLASVRSQDYAETELILVDNASPGFRPEEYAEFAPDRLIRNRRNLGFAAANNQGIEAASGEFVLLLNADAWIAPGFIAAAVKEFGRSEDIGTVVPQIRCWADEGTVESTGHVLRRDFTVAHRDHWVRREDAAAEAGDVFGGTAACVFYRRRMLDDICFRGQYFDESFFAYFEDVDLDFRANLAGWRAWYQPELVAYHAGGGSGERRRWQLRLVAEKNRYLSLIKNLGSADLLPNLHHLIAYELYHLLRNLAAPHLFLAVFSFFRRLPGTMSWRRHGQRSRRFEPGGFRPFFVPRSLKKAHPRPSLSQGVELARGQPAEPPRAVSVIVLDYNGYADTVRCLNALRKQSFTDFEVILVDNGSAAGEGERLHREFPEARVILSQRNLGFAGGVNLGAARARGEYLVLLNNDAEPEPAFLDELVTALDGSMADAGCGVLVSADEEPTNDALNVLGYNIKAAFGDRGVTFYPSGGAAILRVSSLRKLGKELFDPLYFIYHEDVSLGFRIRLAGGEVMKVLPARARHRGGATVSRLPRSAVRYFQQRNRVLNLLTFYEGATLWKLAPLLVLDWIGSHLRALLSLTELAAVIRADAFFVAHPRNLVNRRVRFSGLRYRQPLALCQCSPVRDRELMRWFSGEVLPRSRGLNRVARWYLRLVRVPSCQDSPPKSL